MQGLVKASPVVFGLGRTAAAMGLLVLSGVVSRSAHFYARLHRYVLMWLGLNGIL